MTDALPATDPALPPDAKTFERPTKKGEYTLFAVLVVACLLALYSIRAIAYGHWLLTEPVDLARIHALFWSAVMSIGAVLLLVVAFASPWVGTVKASGLGANLEVDGK